MTAKDTELIDAATDAITSRYRDDWQEVGAALRTRDGRIVTGVNLDAYLGRIAVCAEAVGIGNAITAAGDQGIETIVAVRHPQPDEPDGIAVVSPCGACRELIYDYDRNARVIVPNGKDGPTVATIGDLLPNKYSAGDDREHAPRAWYTPERRDDDADASLRPQRLADFIGQEQARANLSVFIEAARARKEALDHVLFVGPPGLGKTTLAQIVARELGVNFRATSGPGDRQGRRSRGAAHQSRAARRAVHRRDPPAQSGGGGNPLSGDGGLPARPHHRRGAGGALGQDRSCRRSRWSAPPRAPAC